MFSTDVQSRLDRLAQIQQEIYSLQEEAKKLLGMKAKPEKPEKPEADKPKRVKRGKTLALRRTERVLIARALEDLKASGSTFSAGALMALCRDGKGIKPSRNQISAAMRWALKRGEIEAVGKNELGEEHYRKAVARVAEAGKSGLQMPTFPNGLFQR